MVQELSRADHTFLLLPNGTSSFRGWRGWQAKCETQLLLLGFVCLCLTYRTRERAHYCNSSTMDQAVFDGDLKRVQELIRNGADVNGPYGDSPLLHLAIKKGHVDIALALLAAGADVHAKDSGGWTALRWACLVRKENVQALIDRGSRMDERNHLGETPIMEQRRVTDISLCLLRAGASCEGLEQERVDELLHYAWSKRDLLAIRSLFKDSGRVSILSTDEQEGLLHHACCGGDVFVVHTLLANGWNVSILSTEWLQCKAANMKRSLLLCAHFVKARNRRAAPSCLP